MKLLTAIFVFICFHCKAQTKTATIQVDTSVTGESINIPFSDIIVFDARFDRTKIGCIYNNSFLVELPSNKRNAVFPDSLHNYLPAFFKTFIHTDSVQKDKLFVLVKQFRIAD